MSMLYSTRAIQKGFSHPYYCVQDRQMLGTFHNIVSLIASPHNRYEQPRSLLWKTQLKSFLLSCTLKSWCVLLSWKSGCKRDVIKSLTRPKVWLRSEQWQWYSPVLHERDSGWDCFTAPCNHGCGFVQHEWNSDELDRACNFSYAAGSSATSSAQHV